jgi:hypothetical protein
MANDWHTSLLPVYLAAKYRPHGVFTGARCVLAIHNLAHQVGRSLPASAWRAGARGLLPPGAAALERHAQLEQALQRGTQAAPRCLGNSTRLSRPSHLGARNTAARPATPSAGRLPARHLFGARAARGLVGRCGVAVPP